MIYITGLNGSRAIGYKAAGYILEFGYMGISTETATRIEPLISGAKAVLAKNDRGTYSVPTGSLYPFQWNWDSAFTAMGLSTFTEDRAWTELDTLFTAQWQTGLVPHIVFHKIVDSYFPGPAVWATRNVPASSGISQPPVTATATRYILEHTKDRKRAEERAAALYGHMIAWHDWWARERDPDAIGLVGCLHPWEGGTDNAPVWDTTLAAVPPSKTDYRRRDTGLVDESMRPTKFEYDRYLYLVELYRSLNWDDREIWKHTPFKVGDAGLNAILAGDERDLIALAKRFGTPTELSRLIDRAARRKAAFERLWDGDANMFLSIDLLTHKTIPARTHAGFLAFWGGVASPGHAAAMDAEMTRWLDMCEYGLPTVAPDDPLFDRKRYWRGPSWPCTNWLIGMGLENYGYSDIAERLRQSTLRLIEKSGFCEYYDPLSGEGLGGNCFTWTAATCLGWIADFKKKIAGL